MFTILPNEVLEYILKYLDTYELIQFCEAYPSFEYFFQNGKLVRTVDFSRKFMLIDLDACRFIATKLNYESIVTLKVEGLYWIPGSDLRRLVRHLSNLKELYALDTKLSMRPNSVRTYSKLNKLSLTVEDSHFEVETVQQAKSLVNMRYLYMKLTSKVEDHATGASNFVSFFSKMKQLTELWLSDEEESHNRIDYERIAISLPNLNKLVIKSNSITPYYDLRYLGLFKVFECHRCNFETEFICERVRTRGSIKRLSIFEPKETDLENAWDTFISLHKDLPCGAVESKNIYLNDDIKAVNFIDLNFCHTVILCNTKFINAAIVILSSENAKGLKRLSFRSCLFYDEEKVVEVPTPGFKKKRVGIQNNIQTHPFYKIAEHTKYITELEIFNCANCINNGVVAGYNSISSFTNLEKLRLEVSYLLDGSFLEDVFKKCRKLHSLYITCEAQNEKFFIRLCKSLKYASSIVSFRLTYKQLAIDKLFEGFNSIEHKALLRIVLICDNVRYSSNDSEINIYSEFFSQNPQLVLFLLVATQQTSKRNTDIQQVLAVHRADHPAKTFLVQKNLDSIRNWFPVPTAHHDIVFNRTNVSVIHFDEF